MRRIWSEQAKFSTWRRLWVALAQAQMELGVPGITPKMIEAMKKKINDIDFEEAEKQERLLRHDVMAHIHAFGRQVPDTNQIKLKTEAARIIHFGATSCFVQDNGDLCLMKEGGDVLKGKLLKLMQALRNNCLEYHRLPCLGYTHLQPAQLTTYKKKKKKKIN
ncbi:hypothetical protein RFI_18298 [Reticulomyxa filosa]|uniref:Fumarate lyase N-terminal domain-containing protein n=1 Tax=Reticulomyxa filosa TaxID=46433 RepID=X6MY52_RETFI|nr:hypothetical protein RFI_18298 [Reticulomyxa filosa]|eukprot:ETO18945.1 hypothetical protein RFI_18298 [Reticulomyxa filosa]